MNDLVSLCAVGVRVIGSIRIESSNLQSFEQNLTYSGILVFTESTHTHHGTLLPSIIANRFRSF
jgi:hypothetical protein